MPRKKRGRGTEKTSLILLFFGTTLFYPNYYIFDERSESKKNCLRQGEIWELDSPIFYVWFITKVLFRRTCNFYNFFSSNISRLVHAACRIIVLKYCIFLQNICIYAILLLLFSIRVKKIKNIRLRESITLLPNISAKVSSFDTNIVHIYIYIRISIFPFYRTGWKVFCWRTLEAQISI